MSLPARRLGRDPNSWTWGLVLLALVLVLAVLQYRWTGEISRAEREQAQTNLERSLAQVARGVDRELTGLWLAFSSSPPPPASASSGEPYTLAQWAQECSQRWARWTSHPDLLRGVFQVRLELRFDRDSMVVEELDLSQLDPVALDFVPTPWPEGLEPMLQRMQREPDLGRRGSQMESPVPLDPSSPALIVPQLSRPTPMGLRDGNSRVRLLVLWLDQGVLRDEVLGDLVDRTLGDSQGRLDYHLLVRENVEGQTLFSLGDTTHSPTGSGDASVGLFSLLPPDAFDDFAYLMPPSDSAPAPWREPGGRGGRRPGPPPGGDGGDGAEGADGPDPRAGGRDSVRGRGRERIGRMMRRGRFSPSRAFAEMGREPRWQLTAHHPAGALDTRIAHTRWRNLGVSLGILGLLAASGFYLLAATRRAQQLARTQAELVAGVTHELMTPLAALRSAGQNLADGVVRDDEAIRRYGQLIDGEGRRLSEMVGQMLELAGIAAGNRPFEVRSLEIDTWVRQALADLATELDHAEIEVEVDLAPALPTIRGDADALGRVLRNLVGNAIKYAADGRWLGITGRRQGGEVVLTVRDRGPGIDPGDLDQVLEPFRRGSGRAASSVPGSGLGLALVHSIVEAHGGTVAVANREAGGCRITLRLPTSANTGEPTPET